MRFIHTLPSNVSPWVTRVYSNDENLIQSVLFLHISQERKLHRYPTPPLLLECLNKTTPRRIEGWRTNSSPNHVFQTRKHKISHCVPLCCHHHVQWKSVQSTNPITLPLLDGRDRIIQGAVDRTTLHAPWLS